jgi:hypothetical protein
MPVTNTSQLSSPYLFSPISKTGGLLPLKEAAGRMRSGKQAAAIQPPCQRRAYPGLLVVAKMLLAGWLAGWLVLWSIGGCEGA